MRLYEIRDLSKSEVRITKDTKKSSLPVEVTTDPVNLPVTKKLMKIILNRLKYLEGWQIANLVKFIAKLP